MVMSRGRDARRALKKQPPPMLELRTSNLELATDAVLLPDMTMEFAERVLMFQFDKEVKFRA